MLQEEYEKRNKNLALEEKIFSIRILSQLMAEERKEKIKRIEKLNLLLNPQKFVEFKKDLEQREKYLKWIRTKEIEKKIKEVALKIQKVFLECYQIKIENIQNKQEIMKLIYEFRYYCLLPFLKETSIAQEESIQEQIRKVQMLLLR